MRQLTTPRGKFIEKIIRNADGQLVRATFCVYENSGRIKARLVSSVVIESEVLTQNSTPVLCGSVQKNTYSEKIVFEGKTASPYFDLNVLYSSGSKPRAPTI
ncbi:MAG: hypothetical protein V4473_00495 [Patescibacteria group bacterium]